MIFQGKESFRCTVPQYKIRAPPQFATASSPASVGERVINFCPSLSTVAFGAQRLLQTTPTRLQGPGAAKRKGSKQNSLQERKGKTMKVRLPKLSRTPRTACAFLNQVTCLWERDGLGGTPGQRKGSTYKDPLTNPLEGNGKQRNTHLTLQLSHCERA